MQYRDALLYLDSLSNFEHIPHFSYRKELNIQRMKRLLSCFDHPERSFRPVLIAGTKGKGSTAQFLASILSASGLSAGLYTSPHLTDVRERFQVNGRMISRTEFAKQVSHIRKVLRHKTKAQSRGPYTYFEITTLLAFLFFKAKGARWAVLEAGMGGRLDATNAVQQVLSIITPIGLDHTDQLGDTIRKIAGEKAGIIKSNIPVLLARQASAAERVIRARAKQFEAPIQMIRHDFHYRTKRFGSWGTIFGFWMRDERLTDCRIHLAGEYQVENAAVAAKAAMLLKDRFGLPIHSATVRRGLLQAKWPGRFEKICRGQKTFILDIAHNLLSMTELVRTIRKLYGSQYLQIIMGISRDKSGGALFREISRVSNHLILTRSRHPRAAHVRELLNLASPFFSVIIPTDNTRQALETAYHLHNRQSMILVTGSVFVVGEVRKILLGTP
ncbi:MAG: hypothetical protein COV74_07350 [Candidatus Omnitrophica bacterium CG11_big_fil_rev_8_21_14_0_20_45_26]|uniref:Dihydrofolate synthase/folylpolyglutamate synthase n=1 Tax=Candidatus Abzuiibacterium crystallinum TaxID=1974748 RepID=A0A2H0LQ66_9BACT|nr:MAG: hypothetical protein COV74_07350 [Candidatus Omnitrophica bacterium CG11_big_fil_rev_8_21_14_0_20_45_26]PIW65514.1 MAG: hypothetical protein COW12_01605 [Candidatus Omnitrophica bacterium CG12_big_fil_rev_8_21_14_0_65_45_16]